MISKIPAIAVSAVLGTAAVFGLVHWITQPASAPDKERSAAESPVVAATSPANSLSSRQGTTPSVNPPTTAKPRKSTATKTISVDGLEIEFDEENPEAVLVKIDNLAARGAVGRTPELAIATAKLVNLVFSEWAKIDPAGALSAAMTLKSADARNYAFVQSMQVWGQDNFNAALIGAVGLQDPADRTVALTTLADNLDYEQIKDKEALFAAIEGYMPPGDAYDRAIVGLLNKWANQDPAAAIRAAMKLSSSPLFNGAAASIASAWAEVEGDRSKPLQWAMSLPPGEARDNSLENILGTWAIDDPAAAANYAIQSYEILPFDALQSIARRWSLSDPRQALTWLNQVPWSEQKERQEILGNVMDIWVRRDPSAAANEALLLPAGDSEAVIGSMLNYWATKDISAATQWITQIPAGSTKDRAIAAVAPQIAKEDPAIAINWAAAIGDQGLRQKNIESVAQKWLRRDKVAATAWISSAPIPAETRQKLLKR